MRSGRAGHRISWIELALTIAVFVGLIALGRWGSAPRAGPPASFRPAHPLPVLTATGNPLLCGHPDCDPPPGAGAHRSRPTAPRRPR